MSYDGPAIAILLGGFLVLMLLRVPLAFALGIASALTTIYLGLPLVMIAQKMVNSLNSFTFMAVPAFIVAGQVMSEGGISDKLVRFADALVGRLRGGLAQVNVFASMLFGGISGSSVADVASIGSFLIPGMTSRGYPATYAVGVTVTSSVVGVILPPSQNMIYYALAAGGLPISKLFVAGYLPGVIFGLSLMFLCWIYAIRNNHPVGGQYSLRERLWIAADASIGLFTIVIIIGGIVAGIFTATESAVVAVFYALVVTTLVYRSMNATKVMRVLRGSLQTLSMVIGIIMTSAAFGFLLSYLKIPALLTDAIFTVSSEPVFVLLLVNLLLLVLGMLMDMGILILILTPILLPIVAKVGVDPIHFGIIMMVNLGIGLCTPPVGTSLIVGCGIGKVSVEQTVRQMWPFYLVMIAVLMLVTFVPALSLYLPSLLL